MLERGVESLVTGTTNIFMDSSLRSRALQFHFINEDPEKDKDKTSSKKHKKGKDKKSSKKGKKETDDSRSDSSSDDSSSSTHQPPKKKPNTKE